MKKAIGAIIIILIVSVIIYFLFYSYRGNNQLRGMDYFPEEQPGRIISMRQIDSLTADLNYHFTIKNKVVHAVNSDSLRIPVKWETPAG